MKTSPSTASKHPFVSFVSMNLILFFVNPFFIGGVFAVFTVIYLKAILIKASILSTLFVIFVAGQAVCYQLFRLTGSKFIRGLVLYVFWMMLLCVSFFIARKVLMYGGYFVGRGFEPIKEPLPFIWYPVFSLSKNFLIAASLVCISWIMYFLPEAERFIPSVKKNKEQ